MENRLMVWLENLVHDDLPVDSADYQPNYTIRFVGRSRLALLLCRDFDLHLNVNVPIILFISYSYAGAGTRAPDSPSIGAHQSAVGDLF